jgi:hypothetical protein
MRKVTMPPEEGVARAEPGHGVALEFGDGAGDEEGDPDGRPRDRARFAEESENAGADHRPDAEESGPPHGHATALSRFGVLLRGCQVDLLADDA